MDGAFAPWHIIVLVVVLVVLFGSRRLPGAAKSLGESMHIFKKSVSGLDTDENMTGTAANPGALPSPVAPVVSPPVAHVEPAPAPDATQQQLRDLQRQVEDLQRQSAGGGARSEDQTAQPR